MRTLRYKNKFEPKNSRIDRKEFWDAQNYISNERKKKNKNDART